MTNELFTYDTAANVAGGVAKVSYTHQDMIDFILSNPRASRGEIAARYGYTVPWVSRIINSEAFREKFAQRRAEVVDPEILVATENRLAALADEALEKIAEKLRAPQSIDTLTKVADLALKAQGFGAKAPAVAVNVQQTSYVVALPQKAESAEAFEAQFRRVDNFPAPG